MRDKKETADARKQRLAKALKANIARRKAKARDAAAPRAVPGKPQKV